ncbi:signal transduction histidine kinase [Candidatus Magnetomorum sp. HK-1]|nr:signal transduction histidine kinase [Candidatus Magnetomorum sp. HK-1]
MKSSLFKPLIRLIFVSLYALAIPAILIILPKHHDISFSFPISIWLFLVIYLIFFNLNIQGNLSFDHYLDKKLPWFYFTKKRLVVQFVFILAFSVLTIGALFTVMYFVNDCSLEYPSFSFFVFIGSVVLVFGLIGISQSISFIKQWKTTFLEAEKHKQEKLKSDYKVLQNQVNPHFLFNSFNVLISEIKNDPETAEIIARKLSKVYRYVLQSKNYELISLSKELDFISSFTYLHQVRVGEALKVTIDISNESLQRYLPPITLQVLVENAIKHNVMNEENPLCISITTPDTQTLIVKNNLNPKQPFESTNTGLSIIKTRYELLNEDGIKIEKSETEFIVTVSLLDKLK